MPNFNELFVASKSGSVTYKDCVLIRRDLIPFNDGDRFLIKFEKTNSRWVQGIGLYLFGFIEIEDIKEVAHDRTVFWENTAPKEIIIKVRKDTSRRHHPKRLPKKGLLGVKNIWDTGDEVIQSWYGGAAMIVEEIKNGRRYRCNDGHPDENFDDIVFTITKINASKLI